MLSATHNVVFINVISLKKNKPKFVKVRQVHVIKWVSGLPGNFLNLWLALHSKVSLDSEYKKYTWNDIQFVKSTTKIVTLRSTK